MLHDMANSERIGRGVSVRLSRGGYYLRIYDPQRVPTRKEISLGTDSMLLAMARAKHYFERYKTRKWNPWDHGANTHISVQEAMQMYRQFKGDMRSMDGALAVVRKLAKDVKRPIASITREVVSDFLRRPQLSQASRHSYYGTLHAFFKWAADYGVIESNPAHDITRPQEPKTLPKGLTEEELAHLLVEAETHMIGNHYVPKALKNRVWASDAFELIAWTGMRPAEAENLLWEDIEWPTDVSPGHIRVRSRGKIRSKTDQERAITMFPPAEKILRRLQARAVCPYVLTNHTGEQKISRQYLSDRFSKFVKMAKLTYPFELYDLRHTFARAYRIRGGSLLMLKEEMGHKQYVTTQRYGHIGPNERMAYSLALFKNG